MTGNCSHAAAAAAPAAAAAAELVSWNCLMAAAEAAAAETVAWSSAEMASAAAVFETVACEVDDGDGTTAEIKSLLPSGCRFAGEEAAKATAIPEEEEDGEERGAILFLFILRFLVWMLSFLSVMGRGHCNRERWKISFCDT